MLEYELAYIHTGMGIRAFRAAHTQKDWVWIREWWNVRNQVLEEQARKASKK